MPLRSSVPKALAWADKHGDWIAEQLGKAQPPTRLEDGASFPLEGKTVRIAWTAGARTVRLEDDVLRVGGPPEAVGARVLRWLKARAKAVLEAETRALTQRHGLSVITVGIGDPRSRWGSCTADGAIRYSWRLILAPPEVRWATVSHEVAHLKHLDHSRAFHRFHAEIHGGETGSARRWLRAHGAGLHGIGLGGME
jgi:predicted metal-dependent hydrolase